MSAVLVVHATWQELDGKQGTVRIADDQLYFVTDETVYVVGPLEGHTPVVKGKRRRPWVTPDEWEQAHEMRRRSATFLQIAQTLGLTESAVQQHFSKRKTAAPPARTMNGTVHESGELVAS